MKPIALITCRAGAMIRSIARGANFVVNRSQITAITLARSRDPAHAMSAICHDHFGKSPAITSKMKLAAISELKPRFLLCLPSRHLFP